MEKQNYMSQLDDWMEENVLEPLYHAFTPEDVDAEAVTRVRKAIKQKVLGSYHNGLKTKAPQTIKPTAYASRHNK